MEKKEEEKMSGLKHSLEVIEEKLEKGLEAVHLKKKRSDSTVPAESESPAMPEVHLDKKKEERENRPEYSVETENLAIPEVHTGRVDTEPETESHKASGISYDNLAMPEVHFRKK